MKVLIIFSSVFTAKYANAPLMMSKPSFPKARFIEIQFRKYKQKKKKKKKKKKTKKKKKKKKKNKQKKKQQKKKKKTNPKLQYKNHLESISWHNY